METSNRKKNQPLNAYISISDPGETGDGLTEELLRADHAVNPEQMMIGHREHGADQEKRLWGLQQPGEAQVLKLHLQGYDYHAIARKLNRSEKATTMRFSGSVRKPADSVTAIFCQDPDAGKRPCSSFMRSFARYPVSFR